mmetsp:Transcript_14671/g.38117  ORF Transcript_14671/g.38117 Transcript_14671/m.38117 type:complete len:206 (-) Transcript_14671:157-774(-)
MTRGCTTSSSTRPCTTRQRRIRHAASRATSRLQMRPRRRRRRRRWRRRRAQRRASVPRQTRAQTIATAAAMTMPAASTTTHLPQRAPRRIARASSGRSPRAARPLTSPRAAPGTGARKAATSRCSDEHHGGKPTRGIGQDGQECRRWLDPARRAGSNLGTEPAERQGEEGGEGQGVEGSTMAVTARTRADRAGRGNEPLAEAGAL